MSSKVLFFSRSGNCERIAGKIARRLDCTTVEIKDDVSWKGFFGFMKGGYYSIKQKLTNTSLSEEFDVSSVDNIVLTVPLWAGTSAPAGYSFLKDEYKNIKNLYVLICSDGTESAKAFSKLEKLVGPIKNKYGIISSRKNEDGVIDILCDAVTESDRGE